jgi:signal transduction histidine kinase
MNLDNEANNHQLSQLKFFSKIASIVAIIVGLVVIIGWTFNIESFKSIFPNIVAMKANTALCFILIGISLFYLNEKQITKPKLRIAQICAILVGIIGFLTIIEYLFNYNIGIDQLLFKEQVGAILTTNPGRMAETTSINFLIIGISLLIIDLKNRYGNSTYQSFVLIAISISLFSFAGYIYVATVSYSNIVTPMALNTSISFIIVCLGMLFSRPHQGIMATFTSPLLGGVMARRLLPSTIVILLIIGFIRLVGERLGLYDVATGVAITIISAVIILSFLIWKSANSLNQIDLETRKTKEKLELTNKKLEKQTKQLKDANDELESFAFSISHDLRTPLRAIDGYSRVLLKRYEDKLDDQGKRFLNNVRDNTNRMAHLIDDILALSRAGRTELKKSDVNMEALTKHVFKELKATTDGQKVQLKVHSIPLAFSDRTAMHQILTNLISNSIKFTEHEDNPSIDVGAEKGETETIYYITDNGAGFNMKYYNKLFDLFQRLHSQKEFEGTGVGLAIVKRLLNRQGGRIWAEGKVNEGATFFFTLPNKET